MSTKSVNESGSGNQIRKIKLDSELDSQTSLVAELEELSLKLTGFQNSALVFVFFAAKTADLI